MTVQRACLPCASTFSHMGRLFFDWNRLVAHGAAKDVAVTVQHVVLHVLYWHLMPTGERTQQPKCAGVSARGNSVLSVTTRSCGLYQLLHLSTPELAPAPAPAPPLGDVVVVLPLSLVTERGDAVLLPLQFSQQPRKHQQPMLGYHSMDEQSRVLQLWCHCRAWRRTWAVEGGSALVASVHLEKQALLVAEIHVPSCGYLMRLAFPWWEIPHR